jgi:hypothetical protein
MTYIVIDSSGLVIHCVSTDDLVSLAECYPDCSILPRTGLENIGWTYNGTAFTEPV